MKISNEVKIGILAVVAVSLSLWGYKFIMGQNVLTSSNIYYVEYANVNQLQKATPVTINGFPVGVVADLYLKPNDPERKIVVVLDLSRDIQIPKNTKAVIISTGFMGGKAIMLDYEKPCSGEDCAKSGDYLKGETRGLLASMVGEDKVQSYVDIIKSGLEEIIDTLNQEFLDENSNSPIALSVRDLRSTMANLKSSTGQLDALMQRSSGDISGTLKNLNAVTKTIETNNEKIKSIISNTDALSAQLVEADLKQTIAEIKTAVGNLSKTLSTADEAISGVSSTVGKINKGEGTLGKLMQDEALYYELKELSVTLDSLAMDIEKRPYRYIPLKSRRKVQKYDRLDAKDQRN